MKTGPMRARSHVTHCDRERGDRGLAFAIELAFFCYALEGLARAFDPILMFITFRRQQLHDLEGTARAEPAEWAGGVAYVLTDRISVSF